MDEGDTSNFLVSSEPGCHVAFFRADWIIGTGRFDPEDFGMDASDVSSVPDFSIDPESGLLTVINTSDCDRSYFVTVTGPACKLEYENGRKMTTGTCWNDDGETTSAITLVLAVRPMHVMDVCYVPLDRLPGRDVTRIDLFSDIKELKAHSLDRKDWENAAMKNGAYRFPLLSSETQKSFLCSQGFGGHFTHAFEGTCHAIDLECAEGTPIVAVADGTVEDIQQRNRAGGIHTKNLFSWNSILLRLDNGYFAEYVHVATNSANVRVGERVKTGQVICRSGSVGFCPSPHLHLQLHKSRAKDAPTVPFAFEPVERTWDEEKAKDDTTTKRKRSFVPKAGSYYDHSGLVKR